MNTTINLSRQRGVSLVVTLILVVLLSLLALYGAGVLVMDTRSAANDYRAREALAAAETGLEQGYSLLSINRARIGTSGLDANNDGDVADATDAAWAACTAAATTAPCVTVRADDRANWNFLTINSALTVAPTQGSFTAYLMTPSSGDSNLLLYNIVASGASADGSSTAVTKQGVYLYPLIVGEVDTPLASASSIPLSGNYSIVTNPNGGGTGVPVTAWSDSTITPGGSFSSCQPGDFVGTLPSGACGSDDALSKNGLSGPDLVASDPDFPDDLFQFLFGVDEADYQQIKDQATVLADCTSLDEDSFGLIWVTGDCNFDDEDSIGTAAKPVMLVVEGNIQINANDMFYGMMYLFNPAGTTKELKSNGNAAVKGAIIAHADVDLDLLGGFVLWYDADVLSAISNNPSTRALVRLPGTWSDVQ